MNRPPGSAVGLALLRAAVADDREQERLRQARAVRAGSGAWSTCPLPAFRVATPGARVPPSGGPADARPVAVPSPAGPSDDAPLAAPEGDVAVSLGLVQRAQSGDAEAFGELYDRYVDQVYRYIAYRVASTQLAEDLTSETFLRALRRIGSFSWQGRDVGAWFVTIARNLVADHYKSSRYRLELTADDVSVVGGAQQVTAEGPEDAVLEAMQNTQLLVAVKLLGPEQQECIVLRFLQGLSVAETAQVMGKNDGAIKALQYRAVRALARLLPEGVEL